MVTPGCGGLNPGVGAVWDDGWVRASTWLEQLPPLRPVDPGALAGLRAGLERAGLRQERRALRLRPAELEWRWLADNALELRFALPPGSYATTVLRELGDVADAAAP